MKLRAYSLGESPIVLQCFCTHKVILFWESGRVGEWFVILSHFGSILTVAQYANAPTIKFKRLLPQLFIGAILSLATGSLSHSWSKHEFTNEEATPSDSVLMRQLLWNNWTVRFVQPTSLTLDPVTGAPNPWLIQIVCSLASAGDHNLNPQHANHTKSISWNYLGQVNLHSFAKQNAAQLMLWPITRSNAVRYSNQ